MNRAPTPVPAADGTFRKGDGRMKVSSIVAVVVAGVSLSAACIAGPKVAAPKARITAKQAARVALHKYHGRVVGKVALENEDGKWQYAVNVRSGKTLREV